MSERKWSGQGTRYCRVCKWQLASGRLSGGRLRRCRRPGISIANTIAIVLELLLPRWQDLLF
eukprot:1694805-Rhodomonas_salina.1